MKKLMVALAVVAMAMCSQAASIKWRCVNLTDKTGNSFSGTVTLINVEGVGGDVQAASSGGIAYTVIDADYTVGTTYNFYMTYTDGEGNVFTSASKTAKAQDGSTPGITFNMSGGSWSSVPEPTSGLLLLLGVAGLALKRKRA